MSYSDLQNLRQQGQQKKQNTASQSFCRYLVLGNDYYSLSLFQTLRQKFSAEESALVCWTSLPERPEDWRWPGPNFLRGKTNLEAFQRLFPEISCQVATEDALFYKEGEWRSFKGRMKPEALLFEEEFFKENAATVRETDLFPFLQDPAFFEKLAAETTCLTPQKITPMNPQDLINNTYWRVEFTDGRTIDCEYLIWGDWPLSLSTLLKKGEREVDSKILAWMMKQEAASAFFVHFDFERLYIPQKNTLFIPLSYTYPQGHFIGETGIKNDGRFIASFVHFLKSEEMTEEEVGKRHRYLKRTLSKIYDIPEKKLNREQVILRTQTPCRKIDDLGAEKIFSGSEKLFLIGENAPIPQEKCFEYSRSELSHCVRALISLKNIQDLLSF